MKFIIQFRFKPGSKKQAVELFELRGPNRNPGVTFEGAWIAKNSDVAFVLAESADESLIASAAQSWSDHGEYQIDPVVDIEHF